MKNRVVVTGFDLMCALGKSKYEVWKGLADGTINLSTLDGEDRYEAVNGIKVGKVCGIESNIVNTDSLDKSEIMAHKIIESALMDAKLTKEDLKREENHVAISLATSVMGSDYIMKYEQEKKNEELNYIAASKKFISRLAKKFCVGGGIYTTSSACASGTAAFGIAYDLIKEGRADVVLCGGTDHLTDISLFGFNALETISSGVCKPFDTERDGINLGEGSAFFIVENYEHAVRRNAKIYGEILSYSLANDAYHMTSPDPSGKGAAFAMETILKDVFKDEDKQENEKVYINAHGTGTLANDAMEYKAIEKVFAKRKFHTVISSTKSLTGHCLGAAGSIEFGLSMMMLENNKIFPTRNSKTDICETRNLNKEIENSQTPNYFISNSFAFGGNDASIIYKKYMG